MIRMFSRRQKLGWLLASFVVGIACWWTLSVFLRERSKGIEEHLLGGTQSEQEIDSNIPQPKLSPSDVGTANRGRIRRIATEH